MLWGPALNNGANLQDVFMLKITPEVLHRTYIGPLPFPFNQNVIFEAFYTICKRTITKGLCRFLTDITVGPTDGPSVSFFVNGSRMIIRQSYGPKASIIETFG